MDKRWKTYQGALLWNGNPATEIPTEAEAREALKESSAMFARWTSNWDCGTPTEWWCCIKDTFTALNGFSAKQRYRINKGLKNCEVVRLSSNSTAKHIAEIYQIAEETFADYPTIYRPAIQRENFEKWLSAVPENQEIWLCYEKSTGKAVGYAVCLMHPKQFVNLEQVKVPTCKLNTEANAAIVYRIQEYYLKEQHLDYIYDGERNIKHQTLYQDYLIRVLNFRFAYCHLHIVYSPKMQLAVNLLYPFMGGGKIIRKI